MFSTQVNQEVPTMSENMDVIKVEEGEMLEIEIEEDLLKANQQLANANR